MSTISILIVEDEPLIADDIKETCLENGFEVAGVAYTKEEAIELLDSKQVNYVLLDIQLGSKDDGLAIGQKLSQEYYIPFSYISSFSDSTTVNKARDTSPTGYLVKPFRARDIIIQIELGMDISQRGSKTTIPTIEMVNKLATDAISLREYEVLQELCKGKSNLEIAEQLFVSMNTIKTHLKSIFSKMSVKSRTELINRLFS
jgi:DNA-binding NarL/FixJ family response regulator